MLGNLDGDLYGRALNDAKEKQDAKEKSRASLTDEGENCGGMESGLPLNLLREEDKHW